MEQTLLQNPQKPANPRTLWVQTSNIQNCEKINICCLQPPCLWYTKKLTSFLILDTDTGLFTTGHLSLLMSSLQSIWSLKVKSFSRSAPNPLFFSYYKLFYALNLSNSITIHMLMASKFISSLSSSCIFTVQLTTWHLHLDNSKPLQGQQDQKQKSNSPKLGNLQWPLSDWISSGAQNTHRIHMWGESLI